MLNPGPYSRIGNGLVGGGGAMAFYALRLLFMYLLTGDAFQLVLFGPMFAIGAALMCFGFWLQRKK